MRWVLALLLVSACEECLAPPAFTDRRRVSRDEACARIEAKLREKCGSGLEFDCATYFTQDGRECTGDQRATDVERCERMIDRSRDCDEALNQTCGVDCDEGPIPNQ